MFCNLYLMPFLLGEDVVKNETRHGSNWEHPEYAKVSRKQSMGAFCYLFLAPFRTTFKDPPKPTVFTIFKPQNPNSRRAVFPAARDIDSSGGPVTQGGRVVSLGNFVYVATFEVQTTTTAEYTVSKRDSSYRWSSINKLAG